MSKFEHYYKDRIKSLIKYYKEEQAKVSYDDVPSATAYYYECGGALEALVKLWFGHSNIEKYPVYKLEEYLNLLEENRDE